jgi:alpha-methylacyl-CoA racemase
MSRPPAEVYGIASDVSRMGELSPVFTWCTWGDLSQAGEEGASFTGDNAIGSFTWDTRCKVVAAVPGREFGLRQLRGLTAWPNWCGGDMPDWQGADCRLGLTWRFCTGQHRRRVEDQDPHRRVARKRTVSGPLEGVKVIELAGIGPGPYTCMLLADAGAEVLRVDRATGSRTEPSDAVHWDLLNRSRRSTAVNLRQPEGVELVLDLVEEADALVEGWRPGVAERLGVGPDACFERNPRLVYGRMTGWGQSGPLSHTAGHDIDYIALSGALWSIGRSTERPVPPLNLVGDFGGGGMLLAFGLVAALLEARTSGRGQVVDAAMVDGSASLMTMTYAFHQLGWWHEQRGVNILDTGAPFYEVYETADGKWFAVGAIEAQFYAELLKVMGLDGADLPGQMDRDRWPEMKERFAEVFRSKTRDEWAEAFAGTDACGAPVLSPWEAHTHPHNAARSTFVDVAGVIQPGPVPRFSRTPGEVRRPPPVAGADTDAVLDDWGIPKERITRLRELGAID